MTYSVELFCCVVLGLILGHAVFNMDAAVGETVDPCCSASQNNNCNNNSAAGNGNGRRHFLSRLLSSSDERGSRYELGPQNDRLLEPAPTSNSASAVNNGGCCHASVSTVEVQDEIEQTPKC